MNRVIITQLNEVKYLLVYEDDVLVECHPQAEDAVINIGDIYLGRVSKKLKNIESAFISLDDGNMGYLPLDSKPAKVLNRTLPGGLSTIAENDIILVQVTQLAQKMKQAKVTGNISISGQYVALDLNAGSVGVSKRINDEKRIDQLKKLIDDDTYGIVYRTASEMADDPVIIDEYKELSSKLDKIIHRAVYERKTGIILKQKPDYIMLIERYGLDRLAEIKTDIQAVYDELYDYFHDYNNVVFNNKDNKGSDEAFTQIMFYDQDYPFYKLLNLEAELPKLLNKKVWLKSGGFIVIEPTEAMVVIDVNTGKAINRKNRDSHVLKINIEAAKETAKQLRLRNLSGIIMIDFINMSSKEDKNKIIGCLKNEFNKDKIPTNFVEVTKLDVFEITRKKERKPIYEMLRINNDMGGLLCLKEQSGS